jgi:hypothetical protein
MEFHGLTKEVCAPGLELIRPALDHAMNTGLTKRQAGTFVVLSPYARLFADRVVRDGSVTSFFSGDGSRLPEEFILFEAAVGSAEANAGRPFPAVARGKALVSLLSGLPSGVVQQRMPIFFAPGLIKWNGATVRDGWIVSFSGVEAHYDEMFSEWLASAIIGLCRHGMLAPDGVMAQNTEVIPGR